MRRRISTTAITTGRRTSTSRSATAATPSLDTGQRSWCKVWMETADPAGRREETDASSTAWDTRASRRDRRHRPPPRHRREPRRDRQALPRPRQTRRPHPPGRLRPPAHRPRRGRRVAEALRLAAGIRAAAVRVIRAGRPSRANRVQPEAVRAAHRVAYETRSGAAAAAPLRGRAPSARFPGPRESRRCRFECPAASF
jgi:hypothetical protein